MLENYKRQAAGHNHSPDSKKPDQARFHPSSKRNASIVYNPIRGEQVDNSHNFNARAKSIDFPDIKLSNATKQPHTRNQYATSTMVHYTSN